MTRIAFKSDLHLEFFNNKEKVQRVLRYLPENTDYLVLAGDIGTSPTHWGWICNTILAFYPNLKKIIGVFGNHEYYKQMFTVGKELDDHKFIYACIDEKWRNKVVLLERGTFYADNDIVFLGTTMWTTFNKHNFIIMEQARYGMNDYRRILRVDDAPTGIPQEGVDPRIVITPAWIADRCVANKHWLTDSVYENVGMGKKIIVVTHHAPSLLSSHPRFKGEDMNYAYAEPMEELMYDNVDLWIHGHCHDKSDYMVGKCRVVANPYGYHGYNTNPAYNHEGYVDI